MGCSQYEWDAEKGEKKTSTEIHTYGHTMYRMAGCESWFNLANTLCTTSCDLIGRYRYVSQRRYAFIETVSFFLFLGGGGGAAGRWGYIGGLSKC